ncbi:MAG: hypothetical protein ACJ763_18570 [Bdellovibrionia bacterium]
MFNFDPSQMDPKVLMQMSELVRQLPPEKLNRMQSLMHNMMAGHDVSKDLEEFEKSLPPGFREKLLSIVSSQPNAFAGAMGGAQGMGGSTIQPPSASVSTTGATIDASSTAAPSNLREARITILRAVAQGHMSPEEAEKLLFSEG